MRCVLLLPTLLFGYISIGVAQVKLSGYVRSADSVPLVGADILIHNISADNKPLVQFTRTNGRGVYVVTIEDTQAVYSITARAASHQIIVKELKIPPHATAIRQDFMLFPSVSYLDTVKVDLKMTISRTGDTITFNPEDFALKNEITVEDLLSRFPGMEVKDDGRIFFNGKIVSGVLIDGDDLFQKDYQLLTRNAAPKIVDKVQVFKNYQKDQLLKEFNQPGSQVINLKIKDQYKNYLFGNLTGGYGDEGNKIGDVFLIRLSPRAKTQAGINYNTTGTTYATDNIPKHGALPASHSFFSYNAANPLLSINRYYYQNIPGYYQERNNSIQGHTNVLFKTNKWETTLNAKFASDKLRDNQRTQSIYQDGTLLFTNNTGSLGNQLQEYNVTTSKILKNESVYINASLQDRQQNYRLQTASNQSLESEQQLKADNLNWQVNVEYNKKLTQRLLWSNTFGYYRQTNDDRLQTKRDFLFWLFPDNLSLYNLQSKAGLTLRYIKLKSNFLFNQARTTHEIGATFSAEKRSFVTNLSAKNHSNNAEENPFRNDSYLRDPFLLIKYKGNFSVSKNNRLTLSLSNEPHFLRYRSTTNPVDDTRFFYDYSTGYSSKTRTSNWGINVGTKRQPVSYNLFFPEFVQTGFHRLQEGRMDTHGEQSTYATANYSLFSVKLGWVAFAMLNISRNKSDYINSLETKGIATVSSFLYHPNSTNQAFVVINSQKTMGDWPFSLNANILFNRQSRYNSFNGQVNKSDLQFASATIGFKSQFASLINFDNNFTLQYTRNKAKSLPPITTSTHTLLNKLRLFVTKEKVFNTSVTLNSMFSNGGTFQGNFLDLALNRKFLKERMTAGLDLRNILNKQFIANTIITSLYEQENRVEIRGAEIFVTLRYDIR